MSISLSGRQRLERALAIVPWIAEQGGTASIEEVCSRFDIDVEQLQSCLSTVSMVGVYPYTPDALLDAGVEPDHVYVKLPDYFTRPLRLTPTQTFSLIAAGRALLSLPGTNPEGPLARAIAKVAVATGANTAVAIDIDTAPTGLFDKLQRAVADHHRIQIEYHTYSHDTLSVRVVDPWRVQLLNGHWYLQGHCHSAEDTRKFRLDRIREFRLLDETFEAPTNLPPLEVFDKSDLLPTVTLELTNATSWVATQYPIESSTQLANGGIQVTLAVSALLWLERLLLRLGDDALVVTVDPALSGARSSGARRVLARYLH